MATMFDSLSRRSAASTAASTAVRPVAATLAAAAAAVALTACAPSADDAASTFTSANSADTANSAENANNPDTAATNAGNKTATKEASKEEPYEEVDPATFQQDYGSAVLGASGVNICYVKDASETSEGVPMTSCSVDFRHPVPPLAVEPHNSTQVPANSVDFDEALGEFRTYYSPVGMGYTAQPPARLEQGQRVTINGTTLTHLHDGGFRVERDGNGFEVHDGVLQLDSDTTDNLAKAYDPQPIGTICGSTFDAMGTELAVVARAEGTTCQDAMDAIDGYVPALLNGQTQGNAAIWNSPNGWSCSGQYFLSDAPAPNTAAHLGCTADDSGTAKGSGSVIAAQLQDIPRVP